jgi:transcriptional regulator with XRE-family HTH domain
MLQERLKQARASSRITQVELAHRLRLLDPETFRGTEAKRIGEWENGTPRLPFYAVDAIAHVLGRPLAEFSSYPASTESLPAAPTTRDVDARLDALEAHAEEVRGSLQAILRAVGSLVPPVAQQQSDQ